MKNFILILCLLSSKLLFAQFGQVTSVQIIPPNPTDVDQVKAVVEVMLGSSPCTLNNSVSNVNGNIIEISNFYCEGMLSMICNRTDTINLGTLATGVYSLDVNIATGCGPFVPVDSSLSNGFTVSVFSGIDFMEKQNNFKIYPNPIYNSIVNLQANSTHPYSFVCYNSIGVEVIGMTNISGNQVINLPKEPGIYFIKIIDYQSQTSILKCINL